jgi:hypothetical protein
MQLLIILFIIYIRLLNLLSAISKVVISATFNNFVAFNISLFYVDSSFFTLNYNSVRKKAVLLVFVLTYVSLFIAAVIKFNASFTLPLSSVPNILIQASRVCCG